LCYLKAYMSENYQSSTPSRGAALGSLVFEVIKVAVISLAIIVPVRYFLIQPFYVKGESMEPNFYDHEYLIIDELSYRVREPERGEIIVFKYPLDPKQFFIKRIIGLPGERVTIRDDQVYISKNGSEPQLLNETYLPADRRTELALHGFGDVTLGDNQYFLLGDNREQSKDSRTFGPVNKDFIIGRTWIRGWPIERLTVFNDPDYNF
jgi:signal peptidase I